MPQIEFAEVTLGYDGQPAIHHLHGTVEQGTMLAVVGPNGSGKSTLLKGIAGLLRPLSGRIVLSGPTSCGVAYLPQHSAIDYRFPATVFDLLSLGLLEHRGLFGRITAADRERMSLALDSVGLAGFERRPVETLSGGQLQRCLFARVLLQDARVILLDEPFHAIDARTTADLVALAHRWHGEQRTVIAVLHDMALVKDHFPQTLLLARKVIAWGPTATALSAENMLTARRMTEAWDDDRGRMSRAA